MSNGQKRVNTTLHATLAGGYAPKRARTAGYPVFGGWRGYSGGWSGYSGGWPGYRIGIELLLSPPAHLMIFNEIP